VSRFSVVRLAAWLGGVTLGATLACTGGAFECIDDASCADGNVSGTCEDTGFCSFADIACPSARRYGERAGDGLAGECVAADIAATSGDTTTVATTTTETGDTDPGPDVYGPCVESTDCVDPSAVCVTNGNNRMCAPACTTESVPSAECPRDVDNDMAGVACLFTDTEQTVTRCFTICETTADCPAGMTCVAPVCTWASE
jgi:hypothetical protein